MYMYQRKREMIKNVVYIFFILLIAVVSTNYIYYKFQGDRNIDFSSVALDVTYHESTGNKVFLDKVTPVTDSVGLSSKAYNMTLKNNLTENVNYKIKILDDTDSLSLYDSSMLISKEDIRVSIKSDNKPNKIYSLNELEDDILLNDVIDALDTKNLSIRLWISQDSKLPMSSNMYYFGIIKIIEDDNYDY